MMPSFFFSLRLSGQHLGESAAPPLHRKNTAVTIRLNTVFVKAALRTMIRYAAPLSGAPIGDLQTVADRDRYGVMALPKRLLGVSRCVKGGGGEKKKGSHRANPTMGIPHLDTNCVCKYNYILLNPPPIMIANGTGTCV